MYHYNLRPYKSPLIQEYLRQPPRDVHVVHMVIRHQEKDDNYNKGGR